MYGIHLIIVLVCILASVLCSLQGTMFMQNLIDDYITPMVEAHSVDFGPLLAAIGRCGRLLRTGRGMCLPLQLYHGTGDTGYTARPAR